jgi:hypothetical protein
LIAADKSGPAIIDAALYAVDEERFRNFGAILPARICQRPIVASVAFAIRIPAAKRTGQ